MEFNDGKDRLWWEGGGEGEEEGKVKEEVGRGEK